MRLNSPLFRRSLRRAVLTLAAAAPFCGLPAAASAETFLLRSGGRIEGKWLNRDESPRETYVIQPELGGEITLDQSLVAQIIEPSAEEAKYEQLRPTFPDTVEGHWQLSEWCLEHRLLERRRTHLRRILELAPDHADARLALGYRKVQGGWMTRDEEMAARGMILYKGRYRTQQEIDIWESEQKQNLAQREWQSKIKRWHDQLNSSTKAKPAVDSFRAIRDPYAVPALAKLLAEEKRPQVKLLVIETLAQINTREALLPLVAASISDGDEEIRLTCLDHLIAAKTPDALKYYIVALKDKDNAKVNRAGSALRSLGDREAVGPLIDALVTKHKFKIVTGGGGGGSGSPGQMSSSFSSNGGGGFTFGDKAPQIIERELRNDQVLGALIALTNENFSYDMTAWKRWHAAQKNSLNIDARRD